MDSPRNNPQDVFSSKYCQGFGGFAANKFTTLFRYEQCNKLQIKNTGR